MDEMIFGRRYRVTEKIGTGGMAEVYKAVDETLGRTVAVKVLHPRYAADPGYAARFRQEAQAAANLQSPYIVNIYDWGQDGNVYYIVMEHVRGTDLKSIIESKGALESRRVAEIGAQVCAALSVAHGYDVIHRDIKPHNIMVGPDGSVKVMDFGIARAGNTTMTQTGSVLGTAHYVSPEQAQGRELKPQSDLYSLGIVLYEAATGRLPFEADTPVAVALKQVNEQPVRPSKVNPAVSPDLERVIGRALAKDPAKRYATADEMRRDLQRIVAGETVTPPTTAPDTADWTAVLPAVGPGGYATPPAIRPVPRRRPAWIWVAIVITLVATGLIGAYAMGLLGPQGVPVPDLTGTTQAAAEQALTDAGFVLGSVDDRYHDEAPVGVVVDQSPVAGVSLPKGSEVSITLSKGPEMVEVPDLRTLTEAEAIAELEEAGLVARPLPSEPDEKAPPGTVFKQDPAAGEIVKKSSRVSYVVSRGVETVEVPNVVGKKHAEAVAILKKVGFKVDPSEQFNEDVAAGVVADQNPKAKLKVAKGSRVTIVVSKGSANVTVPDVVGRTLNEAISMLESAGLAHKVTYDPHSNNGIVLEQDPPRGTRVVRGTAVQLLVDATPP